MKRAFILIFTALILFSWAETYTADNIPSIEGNWKTYDDTGRLDGIVRIYKENGKYLGQIINLPIPEHKDSICDNCEGEDKDKPILGLVILKNLEPDGNKFINGRILDPYSGKYYDCQAELIENGKKLKLRGYMWFSFIGRSMYWDRDN